MAFDWSSITGNKKLMQFGGEALQDLGYGLTRSPTIGGAFGEATQRMAQMQPYRDKMAQQEAATARQAEEVNMTKEWLKAKGRDDLLPLVDAGQGMFALQEATKVAQAPDQTSGMQNYEYLISRGVPPGEALNRAFSSGGVTVKVGDEGPRMGTIPGGYAAVEDPSSPAGFRMERVPGGPAEQEAAAAAAQAEAAGGRRDLATEIITTAAGSARDALNSGAASAGILGAVAANYPESQAAELRRQIEVLKSNASIENLTAMRQASPTGGALGAVSDRENAMLSAASGAIDPNASPEQVAAAIDNYERTLLKVVHGPVAGEQIYRETRAAAMPANGNDVDSILKRYGVQ